MRECVRQHACLRRGGLQGRGGIQREIGRRGSGRFALGKAARRQVMQLFHDGMIVDIYGHVYGRHGGQFVRRGMKVFMEFGVRRRGRTLRRCKSMSMCMVVMADRCGAGA